MELENQRKNCAKKSLMKKISNYGIHVNTDKRVKVSIDQFKICLENGLDFELYDLNMAKTNELYL